VVGYARLDRRNSWAKGEIGVTMSNAVIEAATRAAEVGDAKRSAAKIVSKNISKNESNANKNAN